MVPGRRRGSRRRLILSTVLLLSSLCWNAVGGSRLQNAVSDVWRENHFSLWNSDKTTTTTTTTGGIIVYTVREDWEEAMKSKGYKIRTNNMDEALDGSKLVTLDDGTTDVGRFSIKLSFQGALKNYLWIDANSRQNYEAQFGEAVNLKFYEFAGATVCGFGGMWKQYDDPSQGDLRLRINDEEFNLGDLLKNYLNESRFVGIIVEQGFDVLRFVTTSSETKFNLRKIQLSASCGPAPTGVPSAKPTGHPSAKPTVSPSRAPSAAPSSAPTRAPSSLPTLSTVPSSVPSLSHRPSLSFAPSVSRRPSLTPSVSAAPSDVPSHRPSDQPSLTPSVSLAPSDPPSHVPTDAPTTTPLWARPIQIVASLLLSIVSCFL